jgi:broad specificity phosphatase PhoE
MVRYLLIEPGATELDDQGRMKGAMDMPLSESGHGQVLRAVEQLAGLKLERLYAAPCQSARQTAATLSRWCGGRVKVVEAFRNLDHGLWSGKKIEEVRTQQPRIYRKGQNVPDQVCPPGGETVEQARVRVSKMLTKIERKYRTGTVAVVVPDPLASVVRSVLLGDAMGNLWQNETDEARWELIESQPAAV